MDTGWVGWLEPDGPGRGRRRFRAWIFTAVLSRHRFVYPVFQETTATAIEACEAAWSFFGGIFQALLFDNTKTVVVEAHPLEPRLNRGFLEYAQTPGFVIDATRLHTPTDKARVERAVRTVSEDRFGGEVPAHDRGGSRESGAMEPGRVRLQAPGQDPAPALRALRRRRATDRAATPRTHGAVRRASVGRAQGAPWPARAVGQGAVLTAARFPGQDSRRTRGPQHGPHLPSRGPGQDVLRRPGGIRGADAILVERHRPGSMIVASNRGPDEWLATFADPVRAQSAIDRLANNAYDLVVEGESYRSRLKS